MELPSVSYATIGSLLSSSWGEADIICYVW
jgi:hypothetical protein